ncbi:HK97 family phage prohead protease [Sinanaerobacter chloroacetimidivorans]|uniref:HK97 family phage prohead protease n=1 Tax=Sinanaerobacter chloroacetimidivorans TaxID=2818044 RepID=A0A8J7W1E5_9FIRM|nr:HK97 family phage prohead protease [Sinanaerobacter chloroacetimidivorans]MBR0599042.1 HK97 family phage prohead protease [Sinanaerobacter chloroacetimidivorans]
MENKFSMIGSKECRAFAMPDLIVQPEGNVIEGHAAVFNQVANIGGWFNEVIERGAFDKTDFTDVLFSINHDLSKIPLARSRNNNENSTLFLKIDEEGLYSRASLDTDNNTEAKALYSAVERKDITGMSFIFYVRDEVWEDLDTDMPTRRITDIAKVIEISAVNFPAYPQTDINSRSESLDSVREKLDSLKADYINKQNALALEQRKKEIILKTFM